MLSISQSLVILKRMDAFEKSKTMGGGGVYRERGHLTDVLKIKTTCSVVIQEKERKQGQRYREVKERDKLRGQQRNRVSGCVTGPTLCCIGAVSMHTTSLRGSHPNRERQDCSRIGRSTE